MANPLKKTEMPLSKKKKRNRNAFYNKNLCRIAVILFFKVLLLLIYISILK
jgi:hypothetical protein